MTALEPAHNMDRLECSIFKPLRNGLKLPEDKGSDHLPARYSRVRR